MTDLLARLQTALGPTYRVERELSGGGMSRVFLARERELERQVVVKVLPPEMAAGVTADRFRREIQLAASLQHPHIVPLLAAGHADDLVYYTMPLIEGESLRAKLAHEGELPIAEAVRILRDVADALAYAHAHGVVHRDIKPDNVLISGQHAVVTDFGVAKAVSAASGESTLTSLGVALGTPAYMAPEQAAADPHVDHRADLYAVGAMAYEMLCGHPLRVAALFGVAAVLVLAVVYFLMQRLGLPTWVFLGAITLLGVGLPIMVVTGVFERRRAIAHTTGYTPAPQGLARWFTWRRALWGGGLAFAGLAGVATIYMAMRLLGIGAVGTLVAKGAL